MIQNKEVLFVDDDLDDQEIFSVVLSDVSDSVHCSFVNTAEEALKVLSKNTSTRPDFIFLDLNLPFMSGFECLRAIKEQPYLKNIPVIIYSTSSRDADKQKAKELGAINYITKPDSVAALKTLLRDIFA